MLILGSSQTVASRFLYVLLLFDTFFVSYLLLKGQLARQKKRTTVLNPFHFVISLVFYVFFGCMKLFLFQICCCSLIILSFFPGCSLPSVSNPCTFFIECLQRKVSFMILLSFIVKNFLVSFHIIVGRRSSERTFTKLLLFHILLFMFDCRLLSLSFKFLSFITLSFHGDIVHFQFVVVLSFIVALHYRSSFFFFFFF